MLQLIQFEEQEKDEQRAGTAFSGMRASEQCQSGLRDEAYFKPCKERRSEGTPTACKMLVKKVCGAREQCLDLEGCSVAKQLAEMEYQERLSSFKPEAATEATLQCRQALSDKEFFRPCEH
ncbi:MAG: hypothetical protein ABFS45_12530 [Pseudomonadota bacterium]